jgi:hypothetical protein
MQHQYDFHMAMDCLQQLRKPINDSADNELGWLHNTQTLPGTSASKLKGPQTAAAHPPKPGLDAGHCLGWLVVDALPHSVAPEGSQPVQGTPGGRVGQQGLVDMRGVYNLQEQRPPMHSSANHARGYVWAVHAINC